MTTTALNYAKIQKKIKTSVESIELPSLNWRIACIAGFVACVALLFFYVWQVNSLTRGYFLINSYEKQINGFTRENKNLQVSFAESSFWGQAMSKIQSLDFQKVTSVKYIQILDNSVATAKK